MLREVGMSSPGLSLGSLTTVSLENVLLDVKELGRGMELIRRECSMHDNSVLRGFLSTNEGKLDKLQRDAKTAEVSRGWRLVAATRFKALCPSRWA